MFMNETICTVALLSVASLAHARTTDEQQTTPAAQATATEVVALVPVKGLNEDNQQQVLAALEALSVNAYVCPECSGRQAKPGTCLGCKQELRLEKMHVVKKADASFGKEILANEWQVKITVMPGEKLMLSRIEETLLPHDVTVERDELRLIGAPTLVFRGARTTNDAIALQKALREAKLFADVVASFDETTSETLVKIWIEDEPPKYETVAAIGDEIEKRMHLADLVWFTPKAKAVSASSEIHG